MTKTPWDAVVAAALSLICAAGAAVWHARAMRNAKPAATSESWEHVRERYPLPDTAKPGGDATGVLLHAVAKANPFSPTRYQAPEDDKPAQENLPPPAPPPPQFVYKGRIAMGTAQRAILEDVTAKKTYFLQVGQEVAGFKVLDIAETRVLLSDVLTKKELSVSLAQSQSSTGSSSGKPQNALSN